MSIQTLPPYLVERPLAKVTASSRWGLMTQLSYIWIRGQSDTQILSTSARLDRDCQWTDILRSLQRCLDLGQDAGWST